MYIQCESLTNKTKREPENTNNQQPTTYSNTNTKLQQQK